MWRVPMTSGRRLSMPCTCMRCEIESVMPVAVVRSRGRGRRPGGAFRRAPTQRGSRFECAIDDRVRLAKLGAFEQKARRTHAVAAHADALLRELDELHELRNGIHAQKRQEPAIERECLVGVAI